MVVITVQAYLEARVHTRKVENEKPLWLKMIDVQTGLGLRNMPDLVKKEICGILETKTLQKNNILRTESIITKIPAYDSKYKYARSDIMEKIIKSYRGVKQCNDGVNRLEKEKQRENFRTILGFEEHDILMSQKKQH